MGESATYLRNRKERKEKAAATIKANAKTAEAAKAKAQGKAADKASSEQATALEAKRAKRAAGYQRSTSLPVDDTAEAPAAAEQE